MEKYRVCRWQFYTRIENRKPSIVQPEEKNSILRCLAYHDFPEICKFKENIEKKGKTLKEFCDYYTPIKYKQDKLTCGCAEDDYFDGLFVHIKPSQSLAK